MYSREKRMKAVELYIKYGKSAAPVIRELGYPGRKTLREWHKQYLEEQRTGVARNGYSRRPRYTEEQKLMAVRHYLEHGRNYSNTTRTLGYPCRLELAKWCRELAPEKCKRSGGGLNYMEEQKSEAAETRDARTIGSYDETADPFPVPASRANGGCPQDNYSLRKEVESDVSEIDDLKRLREELRRDVKELREEKARVDEELKRAKLECDVLRVTAELIKKEPGVDWRKLRNREKALLVNALREDHPLKELLSFVGLCRSTYFYSRGRMIVFDRHAEHREKIRTLFARNHERYGYRRIHACLRREGDVLLEKIVRRIMKEEALAVSIKRRRKYNSYRGESAPAAENLLARDFRADSPNEKWVTDITEFALPAGKVYLSPMIDCFDGMVVSWTLSTSPDADLVNDMLDIAVGTLSKGERPVVHTDRGAHYRWPGWLSRMEAVGLPRSMSKKACTADNAACEGFFGRLKNEVFYNRGWQGVGIDEFMAIIGNYLHWYNKERIKMSLGAKSPLEFRRSLGLAV